MLRFALVADPHIGPEKPYEGEVRKLSRHSLPYLSELAREICLSHEPQFVVQLGDLIEDADSWQTDRANFESGLNIFDRISVPVLNVVGNHDQISLSQTELAVLNKKESLYYSQDIADWHCVVLFSSSVEHTDIHISQAQQEWLAADLEASDKPSLVFLHHPLDNQDLTGNVWFEKYPDYCFVEERAEVRRIFERSGKVQAVFNGHVHQNRVSTIEGIHYVTIQSLVEKIAEPEVCSRSYATVTVDGGIMKVRVEGLDRENYDLVLRI